MRVKCSLTEDEAIQLLDWMDEQYGEFYPELHNMRSENPDMVNAFLKMTKALEEAIDNG